MESSVTIETLLNAIPQDTLLVIDFFQKMLNYRNFFLYCRSNGLIFLIYAK